ncbi:hypothetical protein B0H66DRAFT_386093 [Apodospora peruviana]|uniref:SET domain-containing protein n=1 Tax=Apodospora peruviana TaxID=516989 RepID=A0AAE0HUR8_9PEZI|nr:hypothetical protein B0H66DRAFT_386093 [Apodospora peruviana]
MKDADQKRITELSEWAQRHGAKLNPSLEIYNDDITKFSLRVKETASPLPTTSDAQNGFGAVSCPLSTTLSFLNAVAAGPVSLSPQTQEERPGPAFPPQIMDTVPPHVIGRFFLIKQYLEGTNSFWWPYIASLPQPEHISSWTLPAFWPEDDIDLLEGTNAHVAIQEIKANVKREFKQARKILKEGNFPNWQDYTRMLYNWAFCIFTSRSFRPSLILSQPAKEHVSKLLPQGCELDDFSILQPLFDIANHSMTARYAWDVSSDPSCCQLVCKDTYQPGDQVYNNYGLKSNSELLLGYGFILPETAELHNDYVHVRKRQQEEDAGSLSSNKPKDFLISLRPINHPSSLVGRARQLNFDSTVQLHSLPQFAHFEPALIYDLAFAMSSEQEKQAVEQSISAPSRTEDHQSDNAFPTGLESLVDRIKEALYAKLQYDHQRLKETDPTAGEEGEEAWQPANGNQRLALEYRRQCENVLLNAMRALTS